MNCSTFRKHSSLTQGLTATDAHVIHWHIYHYSHRVNESSFVSSNSLLDVDTGSDTKVYLQTPSVFTFPAENTQKTSRKRKSEGFSGPRFQGSRSSLRSGFGCNLNPRLFGYLRTLTTNLVPPGTTFSKIFSCCFCNKINIDNNKKS